MGASGDFGLGANIETYRLIVESAQEGIAIIQERRLRFCNPSLVRISGYSEAELLAMDIGQFVHPDDRERVLAFHRARTGGGDVPAQYEFRAVSKDGRTVHVHISGVAIEWQGRPATLNFFTDISSQKDAAEALDANTSRIRDMFDNVPIGMFESTLDGKFIYVNNAIARMLKYDDPESLVAEVNRTSIQEALYEDPARRPRFIGEIVRDGAHWVSFENRYKCRDGSVVDAILTFSSYNGYPEGERYLCGFVEDVTARKRNADRLRRSEHMYQLITGTMSDIIWALDRDHRFVYLSPSVERVLGYTAAELLHASWEGLVAPDHHGIVREVFDDFAAGRMTSATREMKLRCKDGSEKWVECSGSLVDDPVDDPEGGELYLVGASRDISDRKRAEKLVAASDKRFETIFRTAPTMISLVEIDDGRFIDVNDKFLKVSGFSREELIGRTSVELGWLTPEQRRELLSDIMDSGRAGPLRLRATAKGGVRVDAIYSGEIVTIDDAPRLLSIFEDITDYARAERALQESEKRYRLLFNSGTDAIFVSPLTLSEGRCFTEVNDVACSRLGYSREELLRMSPRDVDTERDPAVYARVADELLSKGWTLFESEHATRDGEVFPVEVSCRTFESEGITYELSIARDISQRRTDEAEKRQLLQSYQKLFQQMLEGFALHEMICDSAGKPVDYRFLAVNPAFEEMTGFTAAEVVGRTVLDVMPETEDVWIERYGRVVATGRPDRFGNYSAALDRHFLVTAFRNAPGQFVTIFSDVTEQRRYEDALMEAKLAAEDASRVKSDFLANMSHEVRTPLNGIMGMLQLMEGTPLDGEQRELVEAATQSSRRLTRLLCDILDHSMIESGRMTVEPEPSSLRDVFSQVRDLFRGSAVSRKVSLSFAVDDDVPPLLLFDPNRMHQVLGNVVGNAVKYTAAGQVTARAALGPACSGADADVVRVLITVEDTGIGIPPEKMDIIFEPFAQASAGYTRKYEGAGLGLSICKQLVDNMGGTIVAENRAGGGARFTLELPLRVPREAAGAAESSPEPADSPTGSGRILVAEDDEVNRFAIRKILERAGYEVCTVENGKAALEALGEDAFDLILMDVQMPLMDGISATKALRKGEAGASASTLPILALTAYAMRGDEETMLEAGMDAYLPKPVERDALLRSIEQLLKTERGTYSR
jgi:PAS domain S-box-containing protein